MNKKSIFIAYLCLYGTCCFAQEKSKIKYGNVTPDDFKQKIYNLDSGANAVVIAEIGSTEIVGNDKGWFSLDFKKFRRVHILNKNGYDLANVEIELYTDGEAEENLNSLKAVTYNLEDGKVVETKLDVKSGVFKDKINKNKLVKKFSFPNVKEGSIIEYKYEIRSDFTFNLQPWDFQGSYPCLWSEYNVEMPEFYYYISLPQGYQQFYINSHKDKTGNFMVSESSSTQATQRTAFTAGITAYRWVMKDVPALNEENYTSTIRNHVSRIDFQLAQYRAPLTPKIIMGSWQQASETLLKDENFGYSLKRDNGWLNDIMPEASKRAAADLEKAKNIYSYVRDNMTCTNYNRRSIDKPLKAVLKTRNGSEAEINLLLTAMLSKAGLEADPVMLSTRAHGYVYPLYPMMERFNYVITKVNISGQSYFLDASQPGMGFGKLSYNVYNGHARVINNDATPLEFSSDSLLESKLSSLIIINDSKGNFTGTMRQTPGFFESYKLRETAREKGKKQILADIKKGFNADINITSSLIDSLEKYEDPVHIKFDFDIAPQQEDIIYINPMFGEGWKENPFKAARRLYPVEMPYAIDETYLLKMDIPEGYELDELPKQLMVKLNDQNDGMFEYRLSESGGSISLRSHIILKRAIYAPEEYEMLREFFNLIVKKHNEQIVFKKKK